MTTPPTITRPEPYRSCWPAPSDTGTRPSLLPQRPTASLRRSIAAKRVLDCSLAAFLLVLSLPIVAFSALLVRLTTRGPAFYSQQRVGQFGYVFTIYKLRTMYHQCERLSGPTWSQPGDPRVTPVGRVLRALHIDELPQCWNVLRGQMSLIGPRPERPEIATQLATEIADYDARSTVLPGISGHAQVHLPPDTTVADVRDKVALDRIAIQRCSAWFDLLTLVRTGLKVVGLYRQTPRAQ